MTAARPTSTEPLSSAAAPAAASSRQVAAPCTVTAQVPVVANGQVTGRGSIRCAKAETAVVAVRLQAKINGRWQPVSSIQKGVHLGAGKTARVQTSTACAGRPPLLMRTQTLARFPNHPQIVRTSAAVEVSC